MDAFQTGINLERGSPVLSQVSLQIISADFKSEFESEERYMPAFHNQIIWFSRVQAGLMDKETTIFNGQLATRKEGTMVQILQRQDLGLQRYVPR